MHDKRDRGCGKRAGTQPGAPHAAADAPAESWPGASRHRPEEAVALIKAIHAAAPPPPKLADILKDKEAAARLLHATIEHLSRPINRGAPRPIEALHTTDFEVMERAARDGCQVAIDWLANAKRRPGPRRGLLSHSQRKRLAARRAKKNAAALTGTQYDIVSMLDALGLIDTYRRVHVAPSARRGVFAWIPEAELSKAARLAIKLGVNKSAAKNWIRRRLIVSNDRRVREWALDDSRTENLWRVLGRLGFKPWLACGISQS